MLDLSPEIEGLRSLLGDAKTDALIARERREVFSVEPELRILGWGGAMLIATAAAIVLRNNLDRIGPLALAAGIAAAAVACYVWAWLHRARESAVDASILLLGALLVSGDAAFIESQFHLFGAAWYRHFLIVAVLHGVGAYAYRSRALLSLSIAALAAWLGVRGGLVIDLPAAYAGRMLAASALVLCWRFANRVAAFAAVFEHFAANLALGGALALAFDARSRAPGCFLAIFLATVVVVRGFRARRESFVLYGFAYGVIALDVLLLDVVASEAFGLLVLIASTIAAIAALFALHARFQERT